MLHHGLDGSEKLLGQKFCLSWKFDKHDPEMRYVYKHEEDEISDLFSEQLFKSIYTSYLEYLFVFWKLILYSKINFDFFSFAGATGVYLIDKGMTEGVKMTRIEQRVSMTPQEHG